MEVCSVKRCVFGTERTVYGISWPNGSFEVPNIGIFNAHVRRVSIIEMMTLDTLKTLKSVKSVESVESHHPDN